MFVPDNVDDFYTKLEKDKLYQGDILNAKIIGLKKENSEYSPDYWMIITKSCDLVIEEDFKRTSTRTTSKRCTTKNARNCDTGRKRNLKTKITDNSNIFPYFIFFKIIFKDPVLSIE